MIKAETTEGKIDGLNCTKLKNIFVKKKKKNFKLCWERKYLQY